jgi:hypothetical protein
MTGFRVRAAAALTIALATVAAPRAQTDLDALMRQVLAVRDENWKKLQQYVLDERESIDVRGPANMPIWGERREYTWFIRNGFFVRSPLKFNGVEISESDRRKFEADYLHREQERQKRRLRNQPAAEAPSAAIDDSMPRDLDSVLKQTRQPQFISSAYFLRFRFEEGKYALVGRETLDGREVLRIEYYPTRMFGGTDRRRNRGGASDDDRAYDVEFQRLMNKVSLITLWIEPKARQVVKYTFDNVPVDFLPGQWLAQVDNIRASMNMGQPFPDVWLPRDLELAFAATTAAGPFKVRYALEYHDYRQPDVTATFKVR